GNEGSVVDQFTDDSDDEKIDNTDGRIRDRQQVGLQSRETELLHRQLEVLLYWIRSDTE
nr:hypothetical protein [Tanacetum cinerariifolium]